MRSILLLTILLAVGISMTSCKNNQTSDQKKLLEKSWTHSSEESKAGEFEIYRPSDYKEFPVSRYRQVFNFKDNDQCKYLALEANDAHDMKDGKWELDGKANNIKIYNAHSELLYEYIIIELKDDLLKIKAINQ